MKMLSGREWKDYIMQTLIKRRVGKTSQWKQQQQRHFEAKLKAEAVFSNMGSLTVGGKHNPIVQLAL